MTMTALAGGRGMALTRRSSDHQNRSHQTVEGQPVGNRVGEPIGMAAFTVTRND